MNFGKSLKVALATKEMKQKEFGQLIGVSPQQISNWVSSGSISNRNLDTVASGLGMKLSEFIALGE